ncbi:MAG TPA: carbohydrate ABC transporter permease, partial [Microbacterium sp.]|nr:carbohydrate ABC transporter permease [Microbacterium sp.]
MTLIARRRIGTTITYVLMAFLLLFTLFPFLWMVLSALKPADEIRLRTPSFLIRHPTFDNFTRVLVVHHFLMFIKNSLVVSLVACAFSLVISLLAGYVFSRHYRRKLVQSTNFAMLISQMVPPVLLLVPLYITMRNLELLDTYWALILAYTTFVIPLSTFMLSSAYDSIPVSLEEAAEIDGAGRMRTLINVVIPVMIPSIVSVALYSFI